MLSHVNPPRPGGDGIPFVRRLKGGEMLDCRICQNAPVWIYTHYSTKTGSRLCLAERHGDGTVIDQKTCAGCKEKDSERLRGYLWILNSTMNRYEFYELTPRLWFIIQAQSNGNPRLNGFAMTATRGKNDNARVTVHLDGSNSTYRNTKYQTPPLPDASVEKLMRIR